MTTTQTNDNSSGIDLDADYLAPRELRVVLVCDVVESVRWMEQDEDYAVTRWQAFAQHVRGIIVPAHGGSVVKSTGDGMMVEFTNARSAVQAANALHAKAAQGNTDPNPQRHLQLRTGIHETHARRDAHDLYGHGVNLAARITTLAGPGEIIVSAPVRDHLTDVLDGDIEDMGECYLKHIAEPQRVYRVHHQEGKNISITASAQTDTLLPVLAVLAFDLKGDSTQCPWLDDVVADALVTILSTLQQVRVLSRLSTHSLADRPDRIARLREQTTARYVVSGRLVNMAGKLLVYAEVLDIESNELCWAEQFYCAIEDLVDRDSQTLQRLSTGIAKAIADHSVKFAAYQSLPSLSGQSLLLGSINSMHRASPLEFEGSGRLLDTLLERYARHGSVRAWAGKWHVLKVLRGLSHNPKHETKLAIDHAKAAIDLFPQNAHALSVQGHVLCQLSGCGDEAKQMIDAALDINPSDANAWLYKSVWSTMWGNPADAVCQALHARELSPIDPMSYYFDMILAFAYAYSDQHDLAIKTAQKSLRSNRHHAPTLRALLLAQVESDRMMDAKETLKLLLKETPSLTLSSYQSMGSPESQSRRRVYDALRKLEVPV